MRVEAGIRLTAVSRGMLGPTDVGRIKEILYSIAQWTVALQIPCDFRLQASRTVRDISVVLSHSACPQELIYPVKSNISTEVIPFLSWFGSCLILALLSSCPSDLCGFFGIRAM